NDWGVSNDALALHQNAAVAHDVCHHAAASRFDGQLPHHIRNRHGERLIRYPDKVEFDHEKIPERTLPFLFVDSSASTPFTCPRFTVLDWFLLATFFGGNSPSSGLTSIHSWKRNGMLIAVPSSTDSSCGTPSSSMLGKLRTLV